MNATLTWAAGTLQAPITSVSATFNVWLTTRLGRPDSPDDGSAGVREPRRPLPTPPSLVVAL